MLETTRALMAYGFLQIAVAQNGYYNFKSLNPPIPGSRITHGEKLIVVFKALTNTQGSHELLTRLERRRRQWIFIDDR
jgi:hypothetical protein